MPRIKGAPALLALTLAALAPCLAARGDDSASRPNFLVILTDDQGFGDVGCCGAEDLRTPHIDQIFASGMRFENAYANCTVCSPTRAALLTGRYPELVGVPGVIRTHAENNWGWLAPDALLLPAALQRGGYHTAIIGKWHLGLDEADHPLRRGFDHFHGFLGDMMDDYWHHRRHDRNYMRLGQEVIEPEGHATDLFALWACDYLRSRQGKEQPFFLYLAFNAPHTPIQPPDEWLERFQRREPGASERRARLAALIEHMDDAIGRVMAALRDAGLAENTLVVFTSDNGGQVDVGANNGPWRSGKGSMYEGGLRVPMAAAWPGRIEPGETTTRPVMSMDIFATLSEAAGVAVERPIEGRSFLPTLLGRPQRDEPRDLFFVRREGGPAYGGLTINAIIRGPWKLLQNSPFGPQELYNLKDDPQEKVNLAEKERARLNQLAAALRVQVQRGGAVPWQPPQMADPAGEARSN